MRQLVVRWPERGALSALRPKIDYPREQQQWLPVHSCNKRCVINTEPEATDRPPRLARCPDENLFRYTRITNVAFSWPSAAKEHPPHSGGTQTCESQMPSAGIGRDISARAMTLARRLPPLPLPLPLPLAGVPRWRWPPSK
jgi:hypothetical protein